MGGHRMSGVGAPLNPSRRLSVFLAKDSAAPQAEREGASFADGRYNVPAVTMNAVGVDIIEIERIERALAKFGARFLGRVYTPLEAAFCRGRVSELAARFAAKEAVMKALGTGARGVAWREIEVLPNHRGKPLVYLHGRAQQRAERIGLDEIDISLSHSRDFAVAFVVGGSQDLEPDRAAWREKFAGILRERGLLDG